MTYQSVVRDASGNLLTNTAVGIQISILQGTPSGTNVFTETYNPNPQTNINGLVTVSIGDGTPIGALFSSIDWANGPYFLQVGIDPTGGTNYTITGISQLLSVPYALYAETSGESLGASEGWSLSGNASTNSTTDFIGTTDNQALKFRVENEPFGELDISTGSVFFGERAGVSNIGDHNIGIGTAVLIDNTIGVNNIGMGSQALRSNTISNDNIGMGNQALDANARGSDNIGMGNGALMTNTNGNNNIGLGNGALSSNTTSSNNIGIGYLALSSNTVGYNNIGIGNETLTANTSGWSNIGLGGQALSSNTIGAYNIGIGDQALSSNTIGTNNIGMGDLTLRDNISGDNNIGMGDAVLFANTTGDDNIGIGKEVLLSNSTGSENIGLGNLTLRENTIGLNNIALGSQALTANTTGNFNIGMGDRAITANTTGANNTGMGFQVLRDNTTGNDNIGLGRLALRNNVTGNDNIGLGIFALTSITTGSNNIGIGVNAEVGNLNGSNQIRMGNTLVTLAEVQVPWSSPSDKEWKEQIRSLPYGLNFVLQLKPVDYIRKNNEDKTREIGFIAQDIEKLLVAVGYTDQGFLSKNSKGSLSLRYNDFIAILTKAIQELNERDNSFQKMNIELEKRIEKLEQKN